MGSRKNKPNNKNKPPKQGAKDFIKTGNDSTNHASTESSNQLSTPLTVKRPPVNRHSQTPTNPNKRIRTDNSSEDEDSVDDLVKVIHNLKKDMEQLKEMLNLQGEEIKSLKSQLLNNQISKASKCVIVKGLEPETLTETPTQLKATFNKVLTDMGLQSKTTVCEIFRIKSKNPPPTAPQTEIFEPVKIAFLTSFERKMFMKNLKNLTEYRNLKISMDCPQLLLPEYKTANKKAFDIRTQNPGTKTILTINDQKVIILFKCQGQNTYKEWKEPVPEVQTTET